MGTISIIWAIAAVMIVMALLYGAGLWAVRAAAVILVGGAILEPAPGAGQNRPPRQSD